MATCCPLMVVKELEFTFVNKAASANGRHMCNIYIDLHILIYIYICVYIYIFCHEF